MCSIIRAMSERSSSTDALVLSLAAFGEGHREALLLTVDRGLVRAAVFGGAKSKLRALVSPWQTGKVWLYSDPVKKSVKITDFDVAFWRQGIRESLVRTWCASFCVELVARSHGNADWRLVNAFLDGIAVSDDNECRVALLRYMWRTLLAQGIAPDVLSCARCGTTGENRVLYYSPLEEACVCDSCAKPGDRLFPLQPRSLAWLSAVEHLSPAAVRALELNDADLADLRRFLFFLANRMAGGLLKTLETSDGIL